MEFTQINHNDLPEMISENDCIEIISYYSKRRLIKLAKILGMQPPYNNIDKRTDEIAKTFYLYLLEKQNSKS